MNDGDDMNMPGSSAFREDRDTDAAPPESERTGKHEKVEPWMGTPAPVPPPGAPDMTPERYIAQMEASLAEFRTTIQKLDGSLTLIGEQMRSFHGSMQQAQTTHELAMNDKLEVHRKQVSEQIQQVRSEFNTALTELEARLAPVVKHGGSP